MIKKYGRHLGSTKQSTKPAGAMIEITERCTPAQGALSRDGLGQRFDEVSRESRARVLQMHSSTARHARHEKSRSQQL